MRSRTARGSSYVGWCPCAVIGAALIGEDGVRDVTTAPRNGCCGRRYRQQVLAIRYPAPTVGLPPSYRLATIALHRRWWRALLLATNGLESGRFHGFL